MEKGAAKPDAVARRPVLRNTSVCSQQSAADRDSVYNCGQGGIYHGVLYRARSGTRYSAEKKTGLRVWAAVVIALAGLYFLCMTERFTVGKGDVYLFLGAVLLPLHILVIDHFSPRADGVRMACIQFFTCGLLSSVPMFLLETPKVSRYLTGMGADPVCRCAVVRGRIHAADPGTEKCQSDDRFADSEPGIMHIGAGGLHNPRRETLGA